MAYAFHANLRNLLTTACYRHRWKRPHQTDLTFLPLHVILREFCLFVFYGYLNEKWRFFKLFFAFHSLNYHFEITSVAMLKKRWNFAIFFQDPFFRNSIKILIMSYFEVLQFLFCTLLSKIELKENKLDITISNLYSLLQNFKIVIFKKLCFLLPLLFSNSFHFLVSHYL